MPYAWRALIASSCVHGRCEAQVGRVTGWCKQGGHIPIAVILAQAVKRLTDEKKGTIRSGMLPSGRTTVLAAKFEFHAQRVHDAFLEAKRPREV